jgi:viroplasmin and RNaseH domain-containing protein
MNNKDMEETIKILKEAAANKSTLHKEKETNCKFLSNEELIKLQEKEQLKDLKQIVYNKR